MVCTTFSTYENVVLISVDFLVLTLATQNIYMSLICTACISSIILILFGSIRINGTNFGLIESTCVIVFIGISVDYCVHISHQYVKSGAKNRHERTH